MDLHSKYFGTYNYKTMQKKKRTVAFDQVSHIRGLEKIIRNTNADRASLMVANCSHKLTEPVYTSLLYEAYQWPLRSHKALWQKIRAGVHHMRILNRTAMYGYDQRFTEHMDQCLLRSSWQKESINHAIFFKVKLTKKFLIYLKIEVSSSGSLNYPDDWDYIERWCSKLVY